MSTIKLKKTTVPIIEGYCPPLTKAIREMGDDISDYFTVRSQADADMLKTCYTFKGELLITGSDASAPLVIEGPRHIEGELTMALYSGAENPLFTSVSLKSLISITGNTEIRTQWPALKTPESNLGVLDFPALKTVRSFSTGPLTSVHTLNFPSLEHAGLLRFSSSPELHTINIPKIQSLGSMKLSGLPSLRTTRSFAARLKGLVGSIELWDTGLTDISFPNVQVLSGLSICQNRNLTILSLPSLTLVTELYSRGGGYITVADNNPNFILSLPKLTTVTATVDISGLGGIEIPELRVIGKNPRIGQPLGSLRVGAGDNDWYFRCVNCRPTYLTSFSAPKLRNVEGRIAFDTSPELRNISFPVLRSAKEIRMNNTAALELENGISMPSFRHVENVQILGAESRCDFFESLYCRGGVVGNYSCGKDVTAWNPRQAKTWPAFPPSCAGKEVLGLSLPKETFDLTDHLEWLSEMIFIDCYMNMKQFCVHGYTLRTGFLVTMGFIVVATAIMWCVMKRWSRRRRCQTAQENGGKNKVVTD